MNKVFIAVFTGIAGCDFLVTHHQDKAEWWLKTKFSLERMRYPNPHSEGISRTGWGTIYVGVELSKVEFFEKKNE